MDLAKVPSLSLLGGEVVVRGDLVESQGLSLLPKGKEVTLPITPPGGQWGLHGEE